MSSSLQAAFNFALNFNSRKMILSRSGQVDTEIKCGVASYAKADNSMEETVIYAREYVISSTGFPSVFGMPKRGDTLVDAEMGYFTIAEVKELIVFGKIIGFRVRTN